MTPLRLAVMNQVPSSILEILLSEGKINLMYFDEIGIDELSERVKTNKTLQKLINYRLSSRYQCCILLYSLMFKITAFVIIIMTTEKCIRGDYNGQIGHWVFLFFLVYSVALLMKEYFQFLLQGVRYFVRPMKIIDLAVMQ